ncbi:MAG: hypothetical protein DRG24_07855 [Epsilonproteobacteria bacterium]|nr:MAG: hypothetical protein DRG24_07855 [Campylobacterota bacterium]
MKSLIFFILIFLLTECSTNAASNRTSKITLAGTSDLQGILEPYIQNFEINRTEKKKLGGGIARIATLLKQIENEDPLNTFILSNGDDLMNRYFHTFKGEAIYSLMSQSGYELYAPGNHEFDKGAVIFSHALEHAKFEVLCSDLLVNATLLENSCIPYKIVDTKDARVGFFSLMTEDFSFITSAGDVKLKTLNVQSTHNMVQTLQANKCDIIVALTHIGFEHDKNLAQEVDGIDVIFGGHSHHSLEEAVIVNETIIVNGGEKGSYVIRLDLPLNKDRRIDKSKINYTRLPVIEEINPDKDTATLLCAYKNRLPEAIVLGQTTVSWDLTSTALRQNESNVADLVNDLMRVKFDVDIVINNAGAFRGKKVYPPGDITDIMLHEIDEFSNYVYLFNLKGNILRQVLERSGALYDKGGLMQVSGLRYTIDLNQTPQILQHNSDDTWQITKQGNRISHIHIERTDGSLVPLDNDKTYEILSNSFLVNHQGDGYFWFNQYGSNKKNTYTTFYTVMTEAVEKSGILNPNNLDGRIKIIDAKE